MSELAGLRKAFHKSLLDAGVLSSKNGIASNADKDNGPSVRLSASIYEQLCTTAMAASERLAGQTAGASFEVICAEFLREAFGRLEHLRPGEWLVGKDGIQGSRGVATFEQYSHLAKLESVARKDSELRAILGSDYLIKPDVLVARRPITDAEVNINERVFADGSVATKTPLRLSNSDALILHATISCKWTMRSDRAQNARTEALNLMKNRKGHVPHIAVITAEPTPGRIASLAFGTGEIDCVYHFALDELVRAVASDTADDGTLNAMIDGKRLRDIADLPFDLIV
jgi:hypothetical protein